MRFISATIFLLVLFITSSSHSSSLQDRRVSAILFEGLDRVTEQRVNNLIQTTVGQPYDFELVEGDVHTLNHLGEFSYATADVVLQEDGTVHVIYIFREHQIITEVAIVGNSMISDKELLAVTPVMEGLGRDEDAIDRGKRAIMGLYKERGNYLVEVVPDIVVYGKDVDEFTGRRIDESVVVIYQVMEGPRVRVKHIAFAGNKSFSDNELLAEVDSNVSIPFFRRGELNEQVLQSDVESLRRFYLNHGFRDVEISYENTLSPNDKEAKVVFQIEEGLQFSIGGFTVEFETEGDLEPVFTADQIQGLIPLKVGDLYRDIDVRRAIRAINDAYGVLGRTIEVDPSQQAVDRIKQNMSGGGSSIQQDVASTVPYRAEQGSAIEITFRINEGMPTKVGLIEIMGNDVTQDKVIRGRIGLQPGQPFNLAEAKRSQRRLMDTRLFSNVRVTPQLEEPNNLGYRDLLVEVEEMRTGAIGFGVVAGSDSGVIGNISIDQQNFDVADVPESFSELIHGKSFKGAGQQFHMAIQPGDELFSYEIGLTDPRFLDTDYSIGGSAGWTQRVFEDYTQERTSSRISIGRKLGDIWYGSVSLSALRMKLTDFNDNVPQEIFDDRGPASLNSIGLSISRDTLFPKQRPYEGSRTKLTFDQFGIPGGDFSFSRGELRYASYFALNRDYLNRTSTMRIDARIGYIFCDTSPTYERFYYGGRTLRGFDYRTVSPKGTPRVAGGSTTVPIGGDFAFLLMAQYEFPVADRFLAMVFFCDSGTVTNDPGFDEYRVSLGTGLRLYIPQLGNVPLAFDFGFPVLKQSQDVKKSFSFSIQLPF